jgi:hypothetical protein
MTLLKITVGNYEYKAKMEEELAPKTCEAFKKLLPFKSKLIPVRWSGEADWIPLGELDLGIGYENHTSHPWPGQILVYPGGISETEILFPYGPCCFSSKVGQLAGNHFITIIEGTDKIHEMGTSILWEGAKDIVFEKID